MAERPILFSAPMVRAILAGRKTQTRRVLKAVPPAPADGGYVDSYCSRPRSAENPRGMSDEWCWWTADNRAGEAFRVRYVPGDLLWVREAFAPSDAGPLYRADPIYDGMGAGDFSWSWKPSIHMPRWASRITLKVTGVKVERLQDISEEDAEAEGVERLHGGFYPYGITTFMTTFVNGREVPAQFCPYARDSYMMLWTSLHGPGSWDANPWVAAISFERVANSDAGAGR